MFSGWLWETGFYSEPKLKMQAEIVYEDGSEKKILTHKLIPYPGYSWQLSIGPVIRSSLYDGELYDAREEKPGWIKQDLLPMWTATTGGTMSTSLIRPEEKWFPRNTSP